MSLPFRSSRLLLGALLALLLPLPAVAQRVQRPVPPPRRSPFNISAEGDIARTSMRLQGDFIMYAINTGWGDDPFGPGLSNYELLGTQISPNEPVFQFFGMGSPYAGAPRGEWLRHLEKVPSLANALPRGPAQGWTSIINLTSFGRQRQFNAADGQFGRAYSGVTSTTDGSCRDHSQTRGGYEMPAGLTLLAGSNCPETWPVIDGVPTFLGSHPITQEAWLEIFQNPEIAGMTRETFEFSWWRVPPEYQDRSRFFGDFATYGTYNDFNSTTLPNFGNVVPGQSGEPTLAGWPLGLEFSFDAFSYALPTLQNVSFWRAILVNKSREVYGVGLDYDSLYIGFSHEVGRFQSSSVYFDPARNAIFSAEIGASGSPNCNGGVPLPGQECDALGFIAGATAVIVLKSPIGDMRNKLFTNPESPFYDPTNPFRGDTITFNHGHLCDYGDCFTALGGLDRNPRKLFGFYSSTHENLLYDRNPADLPEAVKAIAFRNPFYPDEFVPFAHTVPGHCRGSLCNPAPEWTYTRRPLSAPPGPDTLWFDNCGPAGCSAVWSDTMAAPGRYLNQYANNGMWGIGPFRLAADDTVGLVLAIAAAPDSASLEAYVANTIDFYMKFYLGPTAAPPVRVVATQVTGHDDFGPNAAQVTLFLNDTLETHVDPFLLDFANKLESAGPGTAEYRLRELNPGLVDRIRERALDNVARLFVFKSCDGGRTFTADSDCRGDPARDLTGQPIGVGWRAYAELARTESGFPNVFTDGNVIAGRSYLYVLVGETRGANFAIVDSVDTDGDGVFDALGPTQLDIAPSIMNSLTTSTSDPNVVAVYVPAGVQAGSRTPTFTVSQAGDGPISVGFGVQRAGDVRGGQYRAVFGNRFTVTRQYDAEGVLRSTQVEVAHVVDAIRDPGGPGEALLDDHVLAAQTFTNTDPAGVSLNGSTELVSRETQGDLTTEVLVMDGLGFVLLDSSRPILASTVLEPDRATPGAFFGRPDYPGFQIQADATIAGTFRRQYYVDAAGDSLLDRVRPTLGWADNQASVRASADELGEYELEWTARPFGADAPFRLNRLNPQETQQAFTASLTSRAAGSTGRTDAEALAAVRSALNNPNLSAEDLVPVKVPFRIRNLTMNRAVDVAMVARPNSTILLGSGNDTLRVEVPSDQWVPGDRLLFLETVTQDSMVDGRVVVDAAGNPIRITRPVVTIANAVLNCGSSQPTCNPVIGDGQTDYLDVTEGLKLRVHYANPFDPRTVMDITVTGSLAGADILERGEITSLDNVRVVPNPYLMYSRYETSIQERRILFTNLPPRGTIRIYTATGSFVQQITWTENDVGATGDLAYNLRTHEGNELASGLYIFRVEARDPATGRVRSKIGKFVVIR